MLKTTAGLISTLYFLSIISVSNSNIIEWVESNQERLQKSPRLDHFKKGRMQSTKFEDLSLRLGYPYLYCHHGNCEHGIVFTDLRYITETGTISMIILYMYCYIYMYLP